MLTFSLAFFSIIYYGMFDFDFTAHTHMDTLYVLSIDDKFRTSYDYLFFEPIIPCEWTCLRRLNASMVVKNKITIVTVFILFLFIKRIEAKKIVFWILLICCFFFVDIWFHKRSKKWLNRQFLFSNRTYVFSEYKLKFTQLFSVEIE